MQKCIAISTPGAQFSALAIKGNFRDSIRRVAELGYDAVELHIRDPNGIDVDEIENLLNQYRLPVPTIGTGQAYGEEGLSFSDPDPEIRRKAVQRIQDQMDLASKLSSPRVTIGLIRGTVKAGMEKDRAEGYVMECMVKCLDYNPAITLILEPLNRYETSLYNDTASAKEVIDRIGVPYHPEQMGVTWDQVAEAMRRLPDAVSRGGLWYTVASERPVTEEFIARMREWLSA